MSGQEPTGLGWRFPKSRSFRAVSAQARIPAQLMTEAQTVVTASGQLEDLVGRLENQNGFAEVVASLQAGHGATLGGVWGSSCARGGIARASLAGTPGGRLAARR